ncbi:MAG: GFA family protein [Polyangiales bacterium]|nr:GFA family protein [Sandaracinaceae bacterium]
MQTHRGRCLCGTVSFEVQGAPSAFFLCHCSRCRKVSGSAHGANLFFPDGEIHWLSGHADVRSFALPETRFARSFCVTCGSALPYRAASGRVVVPAGSLDTEVAKRPDAHIQVASCANWDDALHDVPRFDAYPG